MFATHYHSLVRDVRDLQGKVSLAHMACTAGGKDGEDVMFLYKLAPGSSDRSYGLNVARLANLPESVIQRAHERSVQFEREFDGHVQSRLLEEMKKCAEAGDVAGLRSLIKRAEGFFQQPQ
jgi:DNA mismatch repair ATPase MutS